MFKRLSLKITLLSLALLASLSINIGLISHLGQDWRESRTIAQERANIPERFAASAFLSGSCAAGHTVDRGKIDGFLARRAPDLELTDGQLALTEDLLLTRVTSACDLRNDRRALADAMRTRPLEDGERGKAFVEDALTFRSKVTAAAMVEIEKQRALIATLTPEQLEVMPPRTLPQLIPGLSLRQLLPAPPNARGEDRGQAREQGESRGGSGGDRRN